jgi:hypothetical protein
MSKHIDEEDLDVLDKKERDYFEKRKEIRKAKALFASAKSKEQFIAWYKDNIADEVEWTNPAVHWIFASWLHVKAMEGEQWLNEEEIKANKKKYEKAEATKANNKRRREKKEREEYDKI